MISLIAAKPGSRLSISPPRSLAAAIRKWTPAVPAISGSAILP
ncbi:hypothetical protein QWZ10_23470 [Paracoccus cavernae]|uniref:Uncharacterized protein n=1 Tax=Paracoccus cavernae TaxID=1571207 RepID=A0ABT8DE35_9RHOB|nr:hypothetical protein [Paracoccus cavernae]